jgi:hypothetical protein
VSVCRNFRKTSYISASIQQFIGPQVVKKLLLFYGTRNCLSFSHYLITDYSTKPINLVHMLQIYRIYLRNLLILFFHLRLWFQSGLFLSVLQNQNKYLLCRVCHLPRYPIFPDCFTLIAFDTRYMIYEPIPVAVRSKALVFGRSLTGIVDSNPTGGMDVCLLWVSCVVR